MNEKQKILIVDDKKENLIAIQHVLREMDAEVIEATSGNEALAATLDHDFAVAILDVQMPGMTGYELAEHLRGDKNTQVIPIVFLTAAYTDEQHKFKGYEAGGIDYIMKPYSPEVLRGKVNIFLEMARNRRELEMHRDHLETLVAERTAELLKANELLKKEITKRKQAGEALQASEANLRKVILASPDGILIIDRDGIVQFVNPSAESLFGRKAEEIVGELFGFPLMKNELVEVDIVNHGGGPGIAEMRVVETEWNGQSANLVLLHDIMVHKQAKEILKKANEKLTEYSQLKDEFVSTASHELRTPLSIIMGAIRLILDEIPGKIVEEQREVLATAMNNVKRLGRIVDSLLNISRIESGKLDLQKTVVNICELIEDTVSDYESLSQEKGIHIYCEVPQTNVDIYIDQDKTKEVLINLISNSLTFTSEGGWIKVICARQDGRVLVTVQDSGVGIAKEDIPKLFDKFTQFGRRAGPGEKGTGLGLAIVKKLVEMHGGMIEVKSEVGQGTTFTISLPLITEAKAEGLFSETDALMEETLANN